MRPEAAGLAQAAALTIARVRTVALIGLDVADVDVEVHLSAGLPSFTIVGLADKAVAESRERVRAALAAMGLALPPKRITVNLAPADIAKEGSHFDLPIALGLLVIMGVLPADAVEGHLALGELALDGSLRGVSGVLPAAVAAAAPRARPDLPRRQRAGGRLAQGPDRDRGRPQPPGPPQPCPRAAAAAHSRAARPRGGGSRPRPARREGPGNREAGAGDRGCRES
jgi:hypothetical protein